MMLNVVRWLIIVGATLLIVGLIAYARGTKHHHGDDVGEHGAYPTTVVVTNA
jgi:hypothetical protein